MAENEDSRNIGATPFTVNDIDAVIDSLDLDELTKRYGTDAPVFVPLQTNDGEPETNGNPAGVAEEQEPEPGEPATAVKPKRNYSAPACVILSLIIVICALSVIHVYRLAASAAADAGLSAPQQPDLTPLLPDSIALLETGAQGVASPEGMLEKYRPLYALNPEVVGWLKIPNTSIDTLITQRIDSDYYLENDFYGKHTLYGNPYLDARNNPRELNQNTIIYGHSTMTKMQAFYDLYKYMDYSFYISNPIIEYGTLYENRLWKVFAVYSVNARSKDDNGYMFYPIHTEIETSKFPGYLEQIKQRSRFYSDIGIDDNDKILTLFTCFYDNNYPGRYVDSRLLLVARLLREGESSEIDVSKVIDNPDYRRPQVWYDHFKIKNPYAGSENWVQ